MEGIHVPCYLKRGEGLFGVVLVHLRLQGGWGGGEESLLGGASSLAWASPKNDGTSGWLRLFGLWPTLRDRVDAASSGSWWPAA